MNTKTETIKEELGIAAKLIKDIKLNKAKIQKALEDQELYATELVEFLVYKGVAFGDAHTIVGKLIRDSEDKGIQIKEMSDKALKTYHKKLSHKDIIRIMKPEYAVASKKSLSGHKKVTSKRSSRAK